MGFLKKLGQSPAVQNLIGSAAANYFRLVHYTSSYIIDPPDIYETIPQNMPLIYAMWHGEHFMTPFANPYLDKTYVLISRHRDGEINALAASKLGARTIRGSGTHRKNIHKKGGVPAFREMLTVLKEGYCVAMTADVPKVSRVAGQGIVRLAAHSGCPILPVAVASSRRWQLDTWDKSVINLPFSRIAAAAGPLIRVERDADDEQIERLRKCVEDGMNAITARAYALADGKT
ncbi:MAG: lysophospholipid acyltransferase family protein [Rhodobiaceae bacterium]|nr:lysophospholipid acyltransferase family protein [Rhodobiaceae bacterium]MCC0018125.1 lysophospholipid acyltransferase family protein [Rhodobiaceae bacterium]MCC0050611.1 lysophospholipid acyltransferase family protein [Rhodobiaceae bacterium]MCC0059814.1 lysophospholipid acyltransferase family protein [Rhodobiaceae bacterium]